MKFGLLTGSQEIKLAILIKFDFSSCYFVCFFQFQDDKVSLKQASDHHHENTIFQPGQVPLSNHDGNASENVT